MRAIPSKTRAPTKRAGRNTEREPQSSAPHAILAVPHDHDDQERMMEEMCRVLFEFARDLGLPAKRVRRAVSTARRRVCRKPYRTHQALGFQMMLRISEILRTWYRDPAYLDSGGNPRSLPISGPDSFSTLMAKHLPQFKPRAIAELLLTENLLRRTEAGTLVPIQRTAVFARPNAMMLNRVPVLLQNLLSTVRHNTQAHCRPIDLRYERLLTLDRFPNDALHALNQEIQNAGQLLLTEIETWAAQFQLPKHAATRRRTSRVSLQVVTSFEDETAVATRHTRR